MLVWTIEPEGCCLVSSSLIRWSFSGCVLFPPTPTTRVHVLVIVLAFVLVLLTRGYDLAATLAMLFGVGLVTARLSQQPARLQLASVPPSAS